MLRGSKQLLDLCEDRFPSPRPSQRHNLTVRDGFLHLTLMQGNTYMSFDLSEVDLERTPESLVEELAIMLARATAEDPTGGDGAQVRLQPVASAETEQKGSVPDETA